MEQHASNRKGSNLSVKHTAAITGGLFLGGLLVWIIQLARTGDPIGYIILTGLGVLLALPIAGGVLALLIGALGKLHSPQSLSRDDLKSIREAQNVLRAQNQYLTQLLAQAQKNPGLLPGSHSHQVEETPLRLGPGQIRTPEGFVIDGTAFDALDEEHINDEEN